MVPIHSDAGSNNWAMLTMRRPVSASTMSAPPAGSGTPTRLSARTAGYRIRLSRSASTIGRRSERAK